MPGNDFYTFHEYMKKDESALTASMEDYLEMIARLSAENGFTRISELSQALNIQPSSATRMAQRLAGAGYLKYEKYGYLMLLEKGRQAGTWLLRRHAILEAFMRMVGVDEAEVFEETEKVEHMLSPGATGCFERFLAFMRENPDVAARYASFRSKKA